MLTGKKVLTVDDSPTILGFLRSLLTLQHAQVDAASTGQEALDYLRAGRQYDLIVLDLLLPGIDGIEVLTQIRAQDDESAVVMLTGMGGIKSAALAVRQGADGYIEKQDLTMGSDHAEFFYALEQALERRAGIVAQKKLQQVRTDFYSMVTHDLRNPAGAIIVSLEMLLSFGAESLSPEQHELLEIAYRSSEKLLQLINDYLDFATIEAGYLRLDLQETDLRILVEDCGRLAGIQAKARQQILTLDLPAHPVRALVDPDKLKQVFENLISNAIKYTPENGTIAVQLRFEDEQAIFRVRDTGKGISPVQLGSLFTKYHRVPGESTRGVRGTGLGLLIVKEIVSAHEGTVCAESAGVPGEGSTFTVRVPVRGT